MKNQIIVIIFFLYIFNSCSQPSNYRGSDQDPKEIFKDDANFSKYYNSLKFAENFTALDASSKVMNKKDFFREISSGNFVPLKFDSNKSLYFKLWKSDAPGNYMTLIRALGDREYNRYKMEGQLLPSFNFVDLNGIKYTRKTTTGKIIALKLWFIGCLPCVQEMPALNKLVDQYKNRSDILFLSLAFDNKKDLKKFLSQKYFEYAVVPDQKDYVFNDLKISSFPTHIIVNKKGEIVKIVSTYAEMEKIFKDEVSKSN